jgi:hypothetical protein
VNDSIFHNLVTPEFREAERLRSIARHNEAAALRNAEQKARKELIDMLKSGKSPEEVIKEYEAKYAN